MALLARLHQADVVAHDEQNVGLALLLAETSAVVLSSAPPTVITAAQVLAAFMDPPSSGSLAGVAEAGFEWPSVHGSDPGRRRFSRR